MNRQLPNILSVTSSFQERLSKEFNIVLDINDLSICNPFEFLEKYGGSIYFCITMLHRYNALLNTPEAVKQLIQIASLYSPEAIFNLITLLIQSDVLQSHKDFAQLRRLLLSFDIESGWILLQLMQYLKNENDELLPKQRFMSVLKLRIGEPTVIRRLNAYLAWFKRKEGVLLQPSWIVHRLLELSIEQSFLAQIFFNILQIPLCYSTLIIERNSPFMEQIYCFKAFEVLKNLALMMDHNDQQLIISFSSHPYWVAAINFALSQYNQTELTQYASGVLKSVNCLYQADTISKPLFQFLVFEKSKENLRAILYPKKKYIFDTKIGLIETLHRHALLSTNNFKNILAVFDSTIRYSGTTQLSIDFISALFQEEVLKEENLSEVLKLLRKNLRSMEKLEALFQNEDQKVNKRYNDQEVNDRLGRVWVKKWNTMFYIRQVNHVAVETSRRYASKNY